MAPNLKPMAPLWMKVSIRQMIGHFWNNKYKIYLSHLSSFKPEVLISEMFFSVMFCSPSTITFPYSISTKFPPTVSEKDGWQLQHQKNVELLDFTYGYCRSCHLHSHSCCQTFSWSQQHLMGQVEFQPMSNFWEWGILVWMGCKKLYVKYFN